MMRTDYNAEMVENFRGQVKDFIVPIATKLKARQQERIGVEQLKYYDEGFNYQTGNATPKGSPEWIIENGQRMYEDLSAETGEFLSICRILI